MPACSTLPAFAFPPYASNEQLQKGLSAVWGLRQQRPVVVHGSKQAQGSPLHEWFKEVRPLHNCEVEGGMPLAPMPGMLCNWPQER